MRDKGPKTEDPTNAGENKKFQRKKD